MSKQAWTDKPWSIVELGSYRFVIRDRTGRDINIYQQADMHDAGYSEAIKWQRLIVASVNAFANIADPEAFMSAHDKLVAACEGMLEWHGGIENTAKKVEELTTALAAVKEASFPVQIPSEGTVTGVNIRGEHHTISEPVRKGDDIGKIVGDVINEST